ncbi:MAG: VWA domain-containing protein [Spirochaetaceae bacterium]
MHRCRFPHHDHALEPRLREALEAALYAFFVSPGAAESSETPDGPGAAESPEAAPNLWGEARPPAPAVPESLGRLVANIARGCGYRRHTAGVPRLAEKVAHEAVAWCDEQWGAVTEENPFAAEEAELESFRRDPTGHLSPERMIRKLWARYPGAAGTWGTYDAVAAELTRHSAGYRARALAARVAATWARLLRERRSRFEQAFLMHALPPFIEHLNREVPLMARTTERVRDFFGESPGLWDLLEGRWEQIDWDGLEETAGALSREPTVVRLAELLGRSEHVEPEYLTERSHYTTETVRVDLEALGRAEIEGLRFGDDLENAVPAERALLADEDTELVFSKRFADRELLSFDYRSARETTRRESHMEVRTKRRLLARGPIVLCTDTSGSMTGTPERIAKALSLAFARAAAGGGRACYLIAFSTGFRSFELGDLTALPDFTEFLSHSFHGGTDVRPALEESLRVTAREEYRRADVLVISDFRVPKLLDRLTERVEDVRSRFGTLFHSLTIAEAPPEDPLHLFDFHWHYDVSRGDGGITALADRP